MQQVEWVYESAVKNMLPFMQLCTFVVWLYRCINQVIQVHVHVLPVTLQFYNHLKF